MTIPNFISGVTDTIINQIGKDTITPFIVGDTINNLAIIVSALTSNIVVNQDIEITDPTKGIILHAATGEVVRATIQVDSGGTPSFVFGIIS